MAQDPLEFWATRNGIRARFTSGFAIGCSGVLVLFLLMCVGGYLLQTTGPIMDTPFATSIIAGIDPPEELPIVQPTVDTLGLTTLIVQAGDFPAPYRTRFDPMPWQIYPGIPQTLEVYYQEIISGSDSRNEVGHITVVHYSDNATADTAYALMRNEAAYEPSSEPLNIGEIGIQTASREEWQSSDVLFRRCNTIVHVSLEPQTLPIIKEYAQRLDARMQPVVCK
jgi:hypothetical protein